METKPTRQWLQEKKAPNPEKQNTQQERREQEKTPQEQNKWHAFLTHNKTSEKTPLKLKNLILTKKLL